MAWTRDVCEQSRKPPSVVPPQLPDRWRLGRGVACLATFLAACPGPTPPPPVALSITPTSATIRIGETQPFAAKVTGTTNIAVTWAVVEATGGTVSSNGLYTAPMTPGAYRVQATSMAVTCTHPHNGTNEKYAGSNTSHRLPVPKADHT